MGDIADYYEERMFDWEIELDDYDRRYTKSDSMQDGVSAGYWCQRSGELIRIDEMSDSHLLNTVNMLERRMNAGHPKIYKYNELMQEVRTRLRCDPIFWPEYQKHEWEVPTKHDIPDKSKKVQPKSITRTDVKGMQNAFEY